jgi:hypothetical protein
MAQDRMLDECAVPRLVHGTDLAMKPLLYVPFSMALAIRELARTSISPVGSDDSTGGPGHAGQLKRRNTMASTHRKTA